MIRQFSKKNHKIAEYKIGEIVCIQQWITIKRRGKILDKIPAFEGRVIEKEGSEYKTQCETDESKFMVDWLSVTNITNKKKFEDDEKEVTTNHVR